MGLLCGSRIKIVLQFLLLLIAVKLLCLGVLFFVVDQHGMELPVHRARMELKQGNVWYMFVLIAFVGPLLEEGMFRLPLVFSPFKWSVSCAIVTLYLYSFFSGTRLDSFDFWSARLLLASTAGLCSFGLCYWGKSFLHRYWLRRRNSMVFVLSFLFGLSHLMNYDRLSLTLLSSVVLVFPYFISGLIYSYVRLNHSFYIAVLLHILFNSIGFSLTHLL